MNLSRIHSKLIRLFDKDKAAKIIAAALEAQKCTGASLELLIADMSDGRLTTSEHVRKVIKKRRLRNSAKPSRYRDYVTQNGIQLKQGGAPGLKQQR